MVTDGINCNTRGSLLGIAKDARRNATECKRVELSARRFFQTAGDHALINMGWRGGHFFPVIFSGVSLGYGLALLTGADPVFLRRCLHCLDDGCRYASARHGRGLAAHVFSA